MTASKWKPLLLFKQGEVYFISAAVCTLTAILLFIAASSMIFAVLSVLFLAVFLWLCLFFRNPKRAIPDDDSLVLSPADGTVLCVQKDFEEEEHDEPVHRIAVFLSLFNVHVNRMPVSGTVKHVQIQSGKFYPAFHGQAGRKNHQKSIAIMSASGLITVRQIAGLFARRIITDVKTGDHVNRGDIYGMICFGSRVEIVLPGSVTLCVKKGQKVKAGISVIGKVG